MLFMNILLCLNLIHTVEHKFRLRLCLRVHKGMDRMERNNHKGMKLNGMYLSKGNECKRKECNEII